MEDDFRYFEDIELIDPPDVAPDTQEVEDVEEEADGDVLVVCEDGETRACGFALGQCTVGSQTCLGGAWGDCDGARASDEVCDDVDNDCDGAVDEGLVEACGTNEGACLSGVSTCSAGAWTPCKGSVEPIDEVCDALDNDCDGEVDEDSAVDAPTRYADLDGDGFGDPDNTARACGAVEGYVDDNTDCQDDPAQGGAQINAGAEEVCDGVDDDCDGLIDEGEATPPTWYADADADGYGDAAVSVAACEAPTGYVADDTDCDDDALTGSGIHPLAPEVCDLRDNNCNGGVDEGAERTFYRDADGDSYGDVGDAAQGCAPPVGYVADDADCDDDALTGAQANPGLAEVCDLRDNDCNGAVDEGVELTFYRDADGDSYGDAGDTVQACAAPVGYVALGTDCNDDAATGGAQMYPTNAEACDLLDNDCDLAVDEGVLVTFYRDADGDSYGDAGDTAQACTAPAGYVALDGDCNDDAATGGAQMYPTNAEACDQVDNDCDLAVDEGVQLTFHVDNDGDGYGDGGLSAQACAAPAGYVADDADCNDARGDVNPGQSEVCDLRDNDCDGAIDEGVQLTFYRDGDGDGVGVAGTTLNACTAPAGYVALDGDCDDGRDDVYPSAPELCDGADNDCNSAVDDGVAIFDFYRDADGDNYGLTSDTQQGCARPAGYVSNPGDCNDDAATGGAVMYPGNTEVCDAYDNDCDAQVDEGTLEVFYADSDSDGYGDASSPTQACAAPAGYVVNNADCNDSAATGGAVMYPGNTEVCDAYDNDCDTQVDEGALATFYRDADGDTYGNAGSSVQACTAPAGYVGVSGDCNDSAATGGAQMYPGNAEVCDTYDNDCNGSVDEGAQTTYYRDADGDTYGNAGSGVQACTAPAGYVGVSGDCNDNAATGGAQMYPGNAEVCDLLDNDCNSAIDEGVRTTYHRDADGDAYGNPASSTQACTAPAGYVLDGTDCNDTASGGGAQMYPGNAEVCDLLDNDCDGATDEGVQTTYYRDADSDTFGSNAVSTQACTQPAGYVASSGDCNDNNASINPAASEACNGADDDCDAQIDEGVGLTYYRDADGDTYGNAGSATQACTAPVGYVSSSADCDDTRSNVNPGAAEVCDARDNDCDSAIDEGVQVTFYRDRDDDTYGNNSETTQACTAPLGYVSVGGDCNDTSSGGGIYPGATEVCGNGVDDDCDLAIDEGCSACDASIDNDFDGANECDDCDDTNGNLFPGGVEICDGLDNDCDGGVDEDFDEDSDGYSVCSSDPLVADCDDARASVNPGSDEDCGVSGNGNGLDEDCNGYVDEGCDPCDPTDADGDGTSECLGDCDPGDALVFPGAPERCDGLDNDCNLYTTPNCDVSQPCRFDVDGDGDTSDDPDQCKDDLLCACILNNSGSCSGDYRCTALCNTSQTGALGDGCAADQTCQYDLLRSANAHGCGVTQQTIGGLGGGAACGSDSDCRSLSCQRLCVGGGCNQNYCMDYCGSDAYCTAPNTVCRLQRTADTMDGRCWPTNAGNPTAYFLGGSAVGAACAQDSDCDHGFCSAVSSRCTEACCKDSDCPGGYTCSLAGDQIFSGFVLPTGEGCSSDGQCESNFCYNNECVWRIMETSPMCLPDVAGQGARQAGAACASNADCRSQFCDRDLNVCVETCCSDAACPSGLTCELQYVSTTANASSERQVTSARVCVNQSTDGVFVSY